MQSEIIPFPSRAGSRVPSTAPAVAPAAGRTVRSSAPLPHYHHSPPHHTPFNSSQRSGRSHRSRLRHCNLGRRCRSCSLGWRTRNCRARRCGFSTMSWRCRRKSLRTWRHSWRRVLGSRTCHDILPKWRCSGMLSRRLCNSGSSSRPRNGSWSGGLSSR